MGNLAIRLRDIAKSYGPITAVDGLDLDVPEGTCVGLLGPNGAGKSTTMRMLTAQAIADRGDTAFRAPSGARRWSGPWRSPTWATGATHGWTSCRAACAGGC